MTALQGSSREENVYLVDGVGTPVTGLVPADVRVRYKKVGDTSFLEYALDAAKFEEVGDGYYALRFEAELMSQLGPFLYRVTPLGTTPFENVVSEFDINPSSLTNIVTPEVCILSGNVVDAGGAAALGMPITFNPVSGPIFSGDSFIRSTILTTYPDAQGNFSVPLLRGVEVRVKMQEVGVNFKITVPDQETAILKDLLPVP